MSAPGDASHHLDANVTRANWMRPELMHRSFRHIEQIVPTSTVDRGVGPVSELPSEPADLGGFEFRDHLGATRTMEQYLVDEHVDALLVWCNGKVRHESYRNGQTRRDRHIVFSVTKSFTGLLAEMLIEEGFLDDRRLVSDYIPELGRSAYADSTVRHVLDMEVGIDFSEVYDDPQSDIRQFAYASGMRAVPDGTTAHRSLYEYLPTLRKQGEHGLDFHYVTANSEVLGWAIERVTESPIARLFGERVYEHIGAERDAFYMTDPRGKAVAGGGMCVTAPDMLRLALVVANDGVWNGTRIVPQRVIERLKAGGTPRPGLWGNEGGGDDCSYRSQWYSFHPGRMLYAMGIHGQSIFISTEHDSAMVVQSSAPVADGDFFDVAAGYFAAVTDHFAAR
jgi:CubicO group peptidase (beta-lactamase class C family)